MRDVLDKNVTVIMQDEDLDGWQAGGHGKKVQHGILGRVKTRLKQSEQVHTINQWVPTTKLCTNCGKKWDKIKQYNREFVCPHCKHNGGDRDAHASRTMVWLYQNLRDRIGLDGAEYTREDFYDALREMFPDDVVVEGFESSLLDS